MTTVNKLVGWAYPFHFDAEGGVARVGGQAESIPSKTEADESIMASVRSVVLTAPGERVMLCQFGVGADQLLFTPMGSRLTKLLDRLTVEQLSLWVQPVYPIFVQSALDVIEQQVIVHVELQYKDSPDSVGGSFAVGGSGG